MKKQWFKRVVLTLLVSSFFYQNGEAISLFSTSDPMKLQVKIQEEQDKLLFAQQQIEGFTKTLLSREMLLERSGVKTSVQQAAVSDQSFFPVQPAQPVQSTRPGQLAQPAPPEEKGGPIAFPVQLPAAAAAVRQLTSVVDRIRADGEAVKMIQLGLTERTKRSVRDSGAKVYTFLTKLGETLLLALTAYQEALTDAMQLRQRKIKLKLQVAEMGKAQIEAAIAQEQALARGVSGASRAAQPLGVSTARVAPVTTVTPRGRVMVPIEEEEEEEE